MASRSRLYLKEFPTTVTPNSLVAVKILMNGGNLLIQNKDVLVRLKNYVKQHETCCFSQLVRK